MHHLLYPIKDSHIVSHEDYRDNNFGLDEILRVGSYIETKKVKTYTYTYTYSAGTFFDCLVAENFSGTLTGSFSGSALDSSGSILGTGYFSASYFNGSVTGSVHGINNGSPISNSSYTGSLTSFSGSISSSAGGLSGYITSSLISQYLNVYTGMLSGSVGELSGFVSGSNTVYQIGFRVAETKVISRALIHFDLSEVSKSIASSTIKNPRFKLKLKVAKEEELPLDYTIHSFPISQSWEPGIGYTTDNNSTTGVSWNWRDLVGGQHWYNPMITASFTPTDDYLNDSSSAVSSFERGGGTWYYTDGLGNSVASTQSFNYETSDINMDVTPMVLAWISGSIPNNGMMLMSSVENEQGSNGLLTLFSRDTNTIYSPVLDVMWDDSIWVTGSIYTSSVNIVNVPTGLSASFLTGSSITGSSVSGSFSGNANLYVDGVSVNGFVTGAGVSGSVLGFQIFGNVTGSLSSSIVEASASRAAYTQSYVSGAFYTDVFSGSRFLAKYNDGYKLLADVFTGSWTTSSIMASTISAEVGDFSGFNYLTTISGPYITGNSLGSYTPISSTVGYFSGIFIDGGFKGSRIQSRVTGSLITSSYSYTASLDISSSVLEPLNTNAPFNIVIQNLNSKYTSGNVVRINLFGREDHPLKNYTRKVQLSQYLTPKYLPSSSYYSIKDNETEEIVVDFDNYTRLSCDTLGNFFLIDTTGLCQERNYRIRIKVESDNSVYVFDHDDVFKIVR